MSKVSNLIEKYYENEPDGVKLQLSSLLHSYGEECFNAGREIIKKMDGNTMKYLDYSDFVYYED